MNFFALFNGGKQPCPSYVVDADGNKWYCEQGGNGHYGTCNGARDEDTYLYMLRLAPRENW